MKKESIQQDRIKKTGNVTIKYIRTNAADAPVYSDGEQERKLYENFVKNVNHGNGQSDTKFSSWIEEYHLSPVRHNLLKWFPFNPDGTALEVGAGCGALTGILSRKLKKVTALEYSEQRAMITAMRHQKCTNLEVIIGGLQDFVTEQKFDYITVIGVLEYAGKFYGGEDPYKSFLVKIEKLLKPEGTLILAIENKIGIKYLCGAKEDHTERIFESIYNYPHTRSVHTFSRKELAEILNASGLKYLQWYYPLPDYKLPQQIVSDDTPPRDINLVWDLFQKGSKEKYLMSEKRLAKTINDAGLFGEFANSFLVTAGKRNIQEESKCIHFIGANTNKKKKFRTNKSISRNGDKMQFILSPDNDEAIEFVEKIPEREISAKEFFGNNAETVIGKQSGSCLIYPYVSFPAMLELMAEEINSGDSEFGKNRIEQYISFLSKLPSLKCVPQEFLNELGLQENEIPEPVNCLKLGVIDCVPHNIMIDPDNGKYCIIDNEFTYDFPIPVDFLIWRAIYTLVSDLQEQIQSQVRRDRKVTIFYGHGNNRHYIPISWLSFLDNLEIPRQNLIRWFSAWQNKISYDKTAAYVRLKDNRKALGKITIDEIAVKNKIADKIFRLLHKARRLL